MFYFRERERGGGVYGCVDVLIFYIYVYYNLNFIFVKCFFWKYLKYDGLLVFLLNVILILEKKILIE